MFVNRSNYSDTAILKLKMQHGFTLIEVMVAVAVVAVALPAMTMAMMSQIDGTAYLRDKMQAQWVAENQIAEVRIKNRTTGQVPKAKQTGVEELAGRKWRWQITATANKSQQFSDIYMLETQVWYESDGKDDPAVVTLMGLVQAFNTQAIDRGKPQLYSDVSGGSNSANQNDSGQSNNSAASQQGDNPSVSDQDRADGDQ